MPKQPPECAGCGATDSGDCFWIPQSFPGVALCESCQFQQLSQHHQNGFRYMQINNQGTQLHENIFVNRDESPGERCGFQGLIFITDY